MQPGITRMTAHTLAVLVALLLVSSCRRSAVEKKDVDLSNSSVPVGTSGTSAAPGAADTAATTAAATSDAATSTASDVATTADVAPERDPDAIKALEEMGAYLRTLKNFQIRSETSRDEVLDSGQSVEFDGVVDMIIARPNRLRAEVTTDKQQRMYFDDGKTFNVWARRVNYYATIPAPTTLRELADLLADKYNLELPLVDLFYWGDRKSTSDIVGAVDVGSSQVDGITCEHYAFRQEGIDWQVWLQQGDYPLPRKLVITTTTDPARPKFTSVMAWNLAPSFDDAAFTFVPPKDAKKIMLSEAPAGESGR
jgi:hypothetical protein